MLINSSVYLGLLILATIGNISFISKFFNQSWKISLFTLANIYILVLYLFALIKKLDFGVYLILIIGITLFINFINKYKEKKEKKINLIEFLWLFPFIIFIRAVPKDYRFTMFDEFNSWAVNIKWLVAERHLGDINSATRLISEGFNQSYPPAQQLFQYIIINSMKWSEANVLIAQIIFLLICLMALNASYDIKLLHLKFIAYISSIILFYIFGLTFNNILADNLLAAHFATCLALSIKSELRRKSILLIGLSLSVLCLIKPISFLFSLLPLTIVILRLYTNKYSHDPDIDNKSRTIKISVRKLIWLIGPMLFTVTSWNLYVKIIGIDTSIKFPNFFDTKTRIKATQITHTYIKTFFGPLFGEDNLAGVNSSVPQIIKIFHVSLFSIFMTLFIFQCLLLLSKPKYARLESKRILIATILFALVYQSALMYLYITFFGEVAALTRYTVPFLYAWLLILLYLFIEEIQEIRNRNLLILISVVVIYFSAPSTLKSDALIIKSDPVKLEKRIEVENLAQLTKKIVGNKDRVYFLYQNSDNFEKFIFSYIMLPIASNDHCSSIGNSYNSKDRWTCNIDLGSALIGYDFLVIGRSDEIFWKSNNIYLKLNSNQKPSGIFKIKFTGKKLSLENVKSA